MPAVPADLRIEARWIVPMTARAHILDQHSVVIRDGRILDILPSAAAVQRYAATVLVSRPAHLLMPGMINAHTYAAATLFRGSGAAAAPLANSLVGSEFVRDGALTAIAEMLRSGITCFGDRYYFPNESAAAAAAQGMRAVIGLPVAEMSDYVTEGLKVRDEYMGHPLISTVFAPHPANSLSDPTFSRIATLADELDAGIVIDLHESAAEIACCIARHGVRPIERLWKLGLLTPALHAVHMVHATNEDLALATRTGISVSLCPQSSLRQGFGLPPVNSLAASGIRLGVGASLQSQDLWGEMKLLALMAAAGSPPLFAWDVLAMATRGGAAVLGLEAEAGTLESGKWADLCCVDLSGPATQPLSDPVTQLVFCGGRDIVSDVWVAGRPLLSEGALTRLDWQDVAARANAWAERLKIGG